MLLIGGLGALLVGMKLLQDATESLATGSLEKLFAKTAKNPWAGIGIGTLATMIIQSSGATTVMVVGFVNAGVMTLSQAVYYIMGANIGTTITAQIVALGGLDSSSFPITQIIISLTLVGVIMTMFFKKKHERVVQAGNLISGLGLLFLGLFVMTTYMDKIFNSNSALKDLLTNTTNPLLLLLIGLVLTAVAQSSSAITSVIIAMAISGVVIGGEGGNGVLYVILGSNIGSTATALLSAIGSTQNGKRTAIIHLLFNTFGAIIFFVVLVCCPNFMSVTFASWFSSSPATQIAMFHTFFNVVCTIIFFPLAKFLVKLSELIVPDKKKSQPAQMDILDKRFLKTPGIALNQAITYYHLMAKTALDDLNLALDAFIAKDVDKKADVDQLENKVLLMSKELTSFIIAVTTSPISENGAKRLSRMQFDIADIVRLTEVADNITGYTSHEVNEHLPFSQVVYDQLGEMKALLNQQFANADIIVDKPSLAMLSTTRSYEDKIDDLRSKMINEHMARLSSGNCSPSSSGVFINLVGNLERCGDHLNFISERSCQTLIKKKDSPTSTGI